MWDERYSGEGYAYGTEPNDFLKAVMPELPMGRVLCLGDGEGRNGVWLARQGFEVTSLDASSVGLTKARRLADQHGVPLQTLHADLQDYRIEPAAWDVIVSIFCHLPPRLRQSVHAQAVQGLAEGGMLVLEAYTPRQLQFGTGGPLSADMMMSLETLRGEFSGLHWVLAEECERDVHEGDYHHGRSAVVQMLGYRPE